MRAEDTSETEIITEATTKTIPEERKNIIGNPIRPTMIPILNILKTVAKHKYMSFPCMNRALKRSILCEWEHFLKGDFLE